MAKKRKQQQITLVEEVARHLCEVNGGDPIALEPGDDPYGDNSSIVDGKMPNGEPAHFRWREWHLAAERVIHVIALHKAGHGTPKRKEPHPERKRRS